MPRSDPERRHDQVPRPSGPYDSFDLSFWNGEIGLAATLRVPHSSWPLPCAVFIHGSGNSQRTNPWYVAIADYLARSGVATLLPDKRGCGQSGGDWRTADLDDYAGDAIAAVAAARSHAGIEPKAVGVLGISQGGHVAPIASVRDPGVAFVIAVSGGAVTLGEQVTHELEQTFRAEGAPESLVRQGLELLRRAHAYVRTGVGWTAYAEQHAALRAIDERTVHGFPSTQDEWYWSWWRAVIDVDPIQAWSLSQAPGLLVFGEEDERDNVPVRRSVARVQEIAASAGTGQLTTRVFSGTGHGMFETDSRQIRQDFLDLLASWILDHTRAKSPRTRATRGPVA